jgi:hypothetical protein
VSLRQEALAPRFADELFHPSCLGGRNLAPELGNCVVPPADVFACRGARGPFNESVFFHLAQRSVEVASIEVPQNADSQLLGQSVSVPLASRERHQHFEREWFQREERFDMCSRQGDLSRTGKR